MAPDILLFVVVVAVALVHVFAGATRFISHGPRGRWLSFAGGVAVAFVFLDLLPGLSAATEHLAPTFPFRHEAYLVALASFAIYYGVEHVVKSREKEDGHANRGTAPFVVHVAAFAILNFLLGYLLAHEERGAWALVSFGAAVALHFLVADRGLEEAHWEDYQRGGRWVLVAAFAGGALLGAFGMIPGVGLGLLRAFVAGSIVLNVMKEELPSERKSEWWPFAAGVVVYGVLIQFA